MPDSKYFGIPFGASGDRATIPEAAQPSGAVSFAQGFGPDYERDPATDPLAKRVPRDETNEYLYQITNALKFLQLCGLPEWFQTDDNGDRVSYPVVARVRHNGAAYISLVANNLATPGTAPASWALDEAFSFTALEATPAEARALTLGNRLITPRRAGVLPGLFVKRTIFQNPGIFSWTKDDRTSFVEVQVWGAGGAGSGCPATGESVSSAGGNGGDGAYGFSRLQAPVGSVSVTVGAGGAPVSGGAGANGAASSFGNMLAALGGGRGLPAGPSGSNGFVASGGLGGAAGSGDIVRAGVQGAPYAVVSLQGIPPVAFTDFGSGGAGRSNSPNAAAQTGSPGRAGAVIVVEYT